jgi:hypothetical protein
VELGGDGCKNPLQRVLDKNRDPTELPTYILLNKILEHEPVSSFLLEIFPYQQEGAMPGPVYSEFMFQSCLWQCGRWNMLGKCCYMKPHLQPCS